MRTLARAATSSLVMLGAALALMVAAVAAIGIGGTRAATPAGPAPAVSALAAAYTPVSAHLSRLFQRELADARTDHAGADAGAVRAIGLIGGAAPFGLTLGAVCMVHGIRRIRASLEPSQDQAEFADTLQIAGDDDEAHGLLQRHLERTLPATSAVVLNRNNSADRLEAVTPLPAGSPLPATLRGAEPRSCLAVRSGRAHRENDGRGALLSCPVCAPVPGTSCSVPLTVGGEVIGSVLLSRPEPYSEPEEQRIRESVGQAATTQAPLSLLLLDLDHFKQVNDQRGHQVGDQVLVSVGATLRNVLRARDFAGRNGGEEFAVLLPDTSIAEALEIAERVRVAAAEISLPGSDVSVTASVGVAVFPDHASTPDRLERLADAALYLAKRQGRNRVELADPSPAPAVPVATAPAPAVPVATANGADPLTPLTEPTPR